MAIAGMAHRDQVKRPKGQEPATLTWPLRGPIAEPITTAALVDGLPGRKGREGPLVANEQRSSGPLSERRLTSLREPTAALALKAREAVRGLAGLDVSTFAGNCPAASVCRRPKRQPRPFAGI
jgi:hypothetical protein